MTRALASLSLLALLAGCEEPPVVPSADVRQQTFTGRIDGKVVVQSAARGNVVVFLYDADREPAPRGNARPLSFAVIPENTVFAGASDGQLGPFSAPFTFSLVAKGKYKLRAVLDRNDCASGAADCRPSDIVPWYGVTNEPNRRDVGGGAVDPVTRQFLTYEITENEDGTMNAVTGATVLIQDSATVPADRPAFTVAAVDELGPVTRLTLRVKPVHDGAVDQRAPAFLVRWADDDNDGIPDDTNGDGQPEVYPKISIRKIADAVASGTVDENDLDRNGLPDEGGVDYQHADGTQDGVADQVVLVAGVDPTPFLPTLQAAPVTTAVPATELTVIVRPIAIDFATRAPLASVPAGKYSVTVVQFTGQTWRLPNELQAEVAPALGLPTVDGQEFRLER